MFYDEVINFGQGQASTLNATRRSPAARPKIGFHMPSTAAPKNKPR